MALSKEQCDTIKRTCWICFADEDDDLEVEWTHPCNCRGTSAWVHQSCLQRWIDEKQHGVANSAVSCPQCGVEYVIIYPANNVLVQLIDNCEKVITTVAPYATVILFLGGMYWSAATYGAVTVLQILGYNEGLVIMEKTDSIPLLVGLPAIPFLLVLYKSISWEDCLLRWWRRNSRKYYRSTHEEESLGPDRVPAEPTYRANISSLSRLLCGGLALPTIAVAFGNIFYKHWGSNWQRAFMGGATYVLLRGVIKMYYNQQQYIQQAYRRIKNYAVD